MSVVPMKPPYEILEPEALFSPSLVIFRPIVERNIRSMLSMVGDDPDRLRPHVKTHKMPAIIKLAAEMGITKHKCATIAEAEMLAEAGCPDVLISYPLVGPNVGRLAKLVAKFPSTTFRALTDDLDAAKALSAAFADLEKPLPVLLDLDVGMGRTGIGPGSQAAELYAAIANLPNLVVDGLHAYDGHIRHSDLTERQAAGQEVQERVLALRDRLKGDGLPVPRLVFGGTPSFPVHARMTDPDVECSPGTCVLHDGSYGIKFPDLPFTPAALILTRVVSRPARGRICLDVGYKAVASDPSGPRLTLVGLPGAALGGQSEEHLVVDLPESAPPLPVGTPLLAIPTHICPTCALYQHASVIDRGRLVDEWVVAARDRVITC
jgi:D-serine deaminase-like pyridoxal phosphate-dependent protein